MGFTGDATPGVLECAREGDAEALLKAVIDGLVVGQSISTAALEEGAIGR